MKTIRHLLAVLLIALMAASCTCQRQAARLYRRCPQCFSNIHATADTTLHLRHGTDTFCLPMPEPGSVVLMNGHHSDLTVQVNTQGDTVTLLVNVPPDTLHVTQTVAVPCPDPPAKEPPIAPSAAALLLATFFLFCAVYWINRPRRRL